MSSSKTGSAYNNFRQSNKCIMFSDFPIISGKNLGSKVFDLNT